METTKVNTIYSTLIEDVEVFEWLANNEEVKSLPLVDRIDKVNSNLIDMALYYLPWSYDTNNYIFELKSKLNLLHNYHNDKRPIESIIKSSAEKFFRILILEDNNILDRNLMIYSYLSNVFTRRILDDIYRFIEK